MKKTVIVLWAALALAVAGSEPEKVARFETRDGKVYQDASLAKVDAAGITLAHASGAARVIYENLPANWKELFGAENTAALEAIERAAQRLRESEDNLVEAKRNQAKAEQAAKKSQADVAAQIRRNALAHWKDDYRMVEYEIKRQTEAFRQLADFWNRKDLETIVAKAQDRWGTDYVMVVYEIKQQSEARARVFRK